MKSAIVTGANGFVGQAVVKELLSHGVEVVAVTHSHTDIFESMKGVYPVACDMGDYEHLPSLINNCHPEVFYHLAWNGTSGPARANEKIQLSNVSGACNAVHAAKAIGCKKYVFASSIMEYEVSAEVSTMRNPNINSLYSTGKLAADYMTRILTANNNLEYNSALISNIYGPGENSPRLINTSIRKLLNGEHLSLSPGNQLYDFIYITDAAKAFVAIGVSGINGRTYYIGSRATRPLRQFLEEMRDTVSPRVSLGFGEIPFNGVGLTYKEFDMSLLFNDTGFEPQVSFAEGIKHTRDWIMEAAKS